MAKLSPQAQAVLDAAHDGANQVIFDIGDDSPVPSCAAAALRAVADQVVPADPDRPERWEEKDEIRAALLDIATELENQ